MGANGSGAGIWGALSRDRMPPIIGLRKELKLPKFYANQDRRNSPNRPRPTNSIKVLRTFFRCLLSTPLQFGQLVLGLKRTRITEKLNRKRAAPCQYTRHRRHFAARLILNLGVQSV
jgi:hypothetical protein